MCELDNYDIKKNIGQGQFGKVFEVKDNRDEKSYALKVISFRENRNIKNCLKEVQALAKMESHQNIVGYYHCWIGENFHDILDTETEVSESGTSYDDDSCVTMKSASTDEASSSRSQTEPGFDFNGNFLFIKTELCQMNLRTWMRDHLKIQCQKKGIKPILDWFFQIAVAVKFIQLKNFVHRDLKPENIFISKHGQANWRFKIGDFGIVSKTLPQSPTGLTKVSKNSYGTVPYAAPEMLNGKEFDGKADVYSMGVILLELLYPMSTIMEVSKVVKMIQQNGKSSDESWQTFLNAHPKEVSKLNEMLDDQEGRLPLNNFISGLNHTVCLTFLVVSVTNKLYQDE